MVLTSLEFQPANSIVYQGANSRRVHQWLHVYSTAYPSMAIMHSFVYFGMTSLSPSALLNTLIIDSPFFL